MVAAIASQYQASEISEIKELTYEYENHWFDFAVYTHSNSAYRKHSGIH
jgi:hypothetical protein